MGFFGYIQNTLISLGFVILGGFLIIVSLSLILSSMNPANPVIANVFLLLIGSVIMLIGFITIYHAGNRLHL